MKQRIVAPILLALALLGPSALAASQDAPDGSRTFSERVKLLFGMGEDPREARQEAPAQLAPAQQPPASEPAPVQTFNDVEIDLEALGGGDALASED